MKGLQNSTLNFTWQKRVQASKEQTGAGWLSLPQHYLCYSWASCLPEETTLRFWRKKGMSGLNRKGRQLQPYGAGNEYLQVFSK